MWWVGSYIHVLMVMTSMLVRCEDGCHKVDGDNDDDVAE